jgi:hypothetical protein
MSNGKPPPFFVPGCTPEEQETAFAAMGNGLPNAMPVPEPGKRIYAISFRHDSDVWSATVGQTMRGRRPVWQGRKKTDTTVSIEDSAIVRAIYPTHRDNLFWVYHDGGQDSRQRSKWALPFLAGEAAILDYFPVNVAVIDHVERPREN